MCRICSGPGMAGTGSNEGGARYRSPGGPAPQRPRAPSLTRDTALMPEYRLRWEGRHDEIHAEVRRAATETGVGLDMFRATSRFVRVQVRQMNEGFARRLQQLAVDGVVVEASESDAPWGSRTDP